MINAQSVPPQSSSTNSISPSGANIKSDFLLDLVTGKKRIDQGKLTDAQFETAADHGLNIDADGKVYRPLPTDHIDRRTIESAGSRDMNAFQFDHPELHDKKSRWHTVTRSFYFGLFIAFSLFQFSLSMPA